MSGCFTCPACKGAGEILRAGDLWECRYCNGTGTVPKDKADCSQIKKYRFIKEQNCQDLRSVYFPYTTEDTVFDGVILPIWYGKKYMVKIYSPIEPGFSANFNLNNFEEIK